MKPNTKRKVIVILLVIFGLAVGLSVGAFLGFRVGTSMVATISLNTQVRHVETGVAALRALRGQEIEAGIEIIERRLDQTIVSLLPEMREGIGIEPHTLSFIDKGLQTAKRYRADNPRASLSRPVADGVKRAFATVD